MQQGASLSRLKLGPLQARILNVIYFMMLPLSQIFVLSNYKRALCVINLKEALVKWLLPTLNRYPDIWLERRRKVRTDVTQESQCYGRHFSRVTLFVVLRIFLSSLTVFNTSSFITRSVQLIFFSSPAWHFKTFEVFPIYLPEVFNFQHHTKLCLECSTLLVSPINLSPICWCQKSSSCRLLLLLWQSRN